MSADRAYQLVVTQWYGSFMPLRYLSEKQDVMTTIDNIKCKCNQYPGISISGLWQNLVHDLRYTCDIMHRIQRPMSRA